MPACLPARILKGKYSEQQAARLVQEILRTVAQCHAKHVLMRDIKPENVGVVTPSPLQPHHLACLPAGLPAASMAGPALRP